MLARAVRTCAFCGERDAVGETLMDGRIYAACREHMVSELDDDPVSRAATVVVMVMRSPGMTYAELANACGVPLGSTWDRRQAQNRFQRVLRHVIKADRVAVIGRRYFPGTER